jgi:UDP-glucose 4-epimerase
MSCRGSNPSALGPATVAPGNGPAQQGDRHVRSGPFTVASVRRPRVLVLGAGFIGTAVARALLDQGCAVSVLTRSPLRGPVPTTLSDATMIVGDAGDMATLAAALADTDEVVYAVGSSSPVESELEPAADIALVVPPLIRLLELLRLRPAVRLLYFSSGGAVYGNHTLMPVNEEAPTRPISSYGIIKLTCENYIRMYAGSFGIRSVILRVGNAYGPGQTVSRGQGVIATLLRSALTDEPVPVYGMTSGVRDYVFIEDVAHAAAQLILQPDVPPVMNVGTGRGHALGEVLELARSVSGAAIPVLELGSRSFDVEANVLDTSRLRSTIEFDPVQLEVGIERAWQHAQLMSSHAKRASTPPHAPTIGRRPSPAAN